MNCVGCKLKRLCEALAKEGMRDITCEDAKRIHRAVSKLVSFDYMEEWE